MEGMQEGSWGEHKERVANDPNFHLADMGPDSAQQRIEGNDGDTVAALIDAVNDLQRDPNNAELIREVKFIANRLGQTSH